MILMQQNFDVLSKVTYLVGATKTVMEFASVAAKIPFDNEIVEFLNDVSKVLMKDVRSKKYSDVITFAFWIRKSSLLKFKERFEKKEGFHLGKGVVFHIAPSNVPVNFAYSLVSGLLAGNANVVRVSSKEFPQIKVITDAINKVLVNYENVKHYIVLVRYGRDKEINDLFSSIADMRVIWGGNQTIAELRKSPLPPRSGEITFADRYSLALIDSDVYLEIEDKNKIAEDFYNDTFFSDQNACTSPRIVIWMGDKIEEAKKIFWKMEHDLVEKKYIFQSIQGVNKLTKAYIVATKQNVKIKEHKDNLIIRIKVPEIVEELMDYRDNSGYFYEYDCKDILELASLCNDKRCQTIAYIGEYKVFYPLLMSGIRGIDRIVPMGKTMDFDLIWDGYDLLNCLTRTVVMG